MRSAILGLRKRETYDELINDLNDNIDICITDPRLCNKEIFIRYMNVIEEVIDKSQISLILYKNDKERCLNNIKNRNIKKVEQGSIQYLNLRSHIIKLNNCSDPVSFINFIKSEDIKNLNIYTKDEKKQIPKLKLQTETQIETKWV